jgi:serine/threonine-protein kinase
LSEDVTGRVNSALEGRYRIERELGAGGMATVYLAHDLKHHRKVALKILKPELAAVIGGDRFLQEIRVTANLQHPHILPLYDSGAADAFLYYVMPYVEGETLRDRLDREKQLPVEEAVRIAVAVGNALDFAHRQEIIHRDIKPANILLQDGEPVVADFGIALAVNAASGARMTETGLSIGTPHYMSPEQASGDRELDGRSDVYALAAMLYEMLTGDPPFHGSTAQAVLARILTEKPTNVTQVRDATPYHVAVAVDRALAKLPADRFASASQFVEALKRGDATPRTEIPAFTSRRAASPSRRTPLVVAAASVLALALGLTVGRGSAPEADPQVVRATLSFADDPDIIGVGDGLDFGLTARVTPDGHTVVFAGRTRTGWQLYRRDLASSEAVPIVGTENAAEPSLSPDGSQVLFFRNSRAHAVPIVGGVPRTLAGPEYGVVLASDGYLYGTSQTEGDALVRAPFEGGDTEILAEPDSGFIYYLPQLLEDERTLLVSHATAEGWSFRVRGTAPERSMIRLVDVGTRQVRDLTPGMLAFFAPPDLLVYTGPSGPTYARFDPRAGELVGAAQPFLPEVAGLDVSLSETGHLVFVKGSAGGEEVVFVQEDGGEAGSVGATGQIGSAVVSPDGSRVLVSQGQPVDLWIYQRSGEAPIRLTFGDGDYDQPAWSGDGTFVWMTSGSGVASDLYRIRADGTGSPELVTDSESGLFAPSTVPGGHWVVFYELHDETQRNILALREDDPEQVVEVVSTPANERAPALSPDERFLAYISDGTGVDEVYVTRFPSGEGRWQVSSGGGWEPVWSEDGRRVFFRSGTGYMAADVDTGNGFRVRRTDRLFESGRFSQNGNLRHWNVVPGDGGFVMVRINPEPPELQLMLNAVTALTPGS